eukprot:CAMPEP_0113503938 /NCGR_PEP_ID=MMETSP0014_2-20120614/34446_1 /TAXON_ID=2857 /ORGANISM="Nitzschia sp." /LENGTH=1025 /DNA_ID=CAMNT_0000399009 /DNA_START=219 /DNA_END=3296 /DNA_ORIENTATION=- /assembly_acc=CAM_ASM_000159
MNYLPAHDDAVAAAEVWSKQTKNTNNDNVDGVGSDLDAELFQYTAEIVGEQRNLHLTAEELLLEIDQAISHPSQLLLTGGTSRMVQEFRTRADGIASVHEAIGNSIEAKKRKVLAATAATAAAGGSSSSSTQRLHKLFQTDLWNGQCVRTILYLSDIHESIRQLEKTSSLDGQSSSLSSPSSSSTTWVAPSAFERSTTKYWVEEDKLDKLLLTCTAQVPLLVYGKSGRLSVTTEETTNWKDVASSISSVYFDSPTMGMYKERIARLEGAKLFRVRWYGPQPQGNGKIFLELKTHHEKWTMDSSLKERVTIREKHMRFFLQPGVWTAVDARPVITSANPKLHGKELDDASNLLVKMHNLVVSKNLRPCVRTVYSRVAFQSSSSNALRLTIDRNIRVIDETTAQDGQWYCEGTRSGPKVIKTLPYPVFEVKLAGSEMPPAIHQLIHDGVIHDAAKFSKFLSGVSMHHSDKIKTLPYWADHPSFVGLIGGPSSGGSGKDHSSSPKARPKAYRTNSSGAVQSVLSSSQTKDSKTIDDSVTTDSTESSRGGGNEGRVRLGFVLKIRSWFRRNNTGNSQTIAAKRPPRVEPKSYFANERTFIQWLSASLWLVTIAALLLEKEADGVTHLTTTGLALSSGALIVATYATTVYFRRIRLMQSGAARGYVDHIAPLLLSLAVIIGVSVLLAEKAKTATASASAASPTPNQTQAVMPILHEEDGLCFLHPNDGVNRLSYQPSDVAIDKNRNVLLVPSLTHIMAHSKSNGASAVKELVNIPGVDLEGLVIIDGNRIFALSEKEGSDTFAGLLEFVWQEGTDNLVLLRAWQIDSRDRDLIGEGLAFIENDNGVRSLAIELPNAVNLYEVPPPTIPEPDLNPFEEGGGLPRPGILVKKDTLNKKLLTDGLVDGRISAMYGFENQLLALHDNDGVLRTWDIAGGKMIAETNLPTTAGNQKQWEGIAIERRSNSESFPAMSSSSPSMLRGSVPESLSSDLIVHLAMDTPPQLWSFSVREGENRGELVFPSCAGVAPQMNL